jgi:dolichol kinase
MLLVATDPVARRDDDTARRAAEALADDAALGPLIGSAPDGDYAAIRPALEAAWLDAGQRPMRRGHVTRSVLHAGMGLGVLGLVHALPSLEAMRWVASAATASAWGMEGSRRLSPAVNRVLLSVFGRTAHAHEGRQVNSATWYTTALCVLSWTVSPSAASAGVAVLAFGDPAASLVGRRFGRTRIGTRSLEGSAAFVAVGALTASSVLWTWGVAWPAALVIGLVAGLAGAVAEMCSTRVDDNLAIPVVAAMATASLGL